MQNFAPWGFSAEQFWQRIDLPVDQAIRPSLYHSVLGVDSGLVKGLGAMRAALYNRLTATKKASFGSVTNNALSVSRWRVSQFLPSETTADRRQLATIRAFV
jgi:hypothetical protein